MQMKSYTFPCVVVFALQILYVGGAETEVTWIPTTTSINSDRMTTTDNGNSLPGIMDSLRRPCRRINGIRRNIRANLFGEEYNNRGGSNRNMYGGYNINIPQTEDIYGSISSMIPRVEYLGKRSINDKNIQPSGSSFGSSASKMSNCRLNIEENKNTINEPTVIAKGSKLASRSTNAEISGISEGTTVNAGINRFLKTGELGSDSIEANEINRYSRFSGPGGVGESNRFSNENIMNIQGGPDSLNIEDEVGEINAFSAFSGPTEGGRFSRENSNGGMSSVNGGNGMSSVNGGNGMGEFVKFGSGGAFGGNRAGGPGKIGGFGGHEGASRFGFNNESGPSRMISNGGAGGGTGFGGRHAGGARFGSSMGNGPNFGFRFGGVNKNGNSGANGAGFEGNREDGFQYNNEIGSSGINFNGEGGKMVEFGGFSGGGRNDERGRFSGSGRRDGDSGFSEYSDDRRNGQFNFNGIDGGGRKGGRSMGSNVYTKSRYYGGKKGCRCRRGLGGSEFEGGRGGKDGEFVESVGFGGSREGSIFGGPGGLGGPGGSGGLREKSGFRR